MGAYATIYYLYKSAIGRTIRIFIFLFLATWLVALFGNHEPTRLPHFLLHIFVMIEIFYKFKIARIKPTVLLSENKGDITRSSTLPVMYAFLKFGSTKGIILNHLKTDQGNFMLQKMQILQSEVEFFPLEKQALLQSAAETAKTVGGSYITIMDVVASYLFLIEPQAKLLFKHNLKDQDLLSVLRWAREIFKTDENPAFGKVLFSGSGIGESLVTW